MPEEQDEPDRTSAARQDGLFDDGKDPQAFRTIGEVASALGIKAHVLRYWEEQFRMLSPVKRSGGRRYYRPEDVALVQRIDRLLNQEGYTIRGAARALEEGEADNAEQAPPMEPDPRGPPAATGRNAALVTRLRTIRETLASAMAEPAGN